VSAFGVKNAGWFLIGGENRRFCGEKCKTKVAKQKWQNNSKKMVANQKTLSQTDDIPRLVIIL
jgi:hypothetical protein